MAGAHPHPDSTLCAAEEPEEEFPEKVIWPDMSGLERQRNRTKKVGEAKSERSKKAQIGEGRKQGGRCRANGPRALRKTRGT